MDSIEDTPYLFALDIGTTAIKFVVFDKNLEIHYLEETEVHTYRPAEGESEQEAEEVWQKVKAGILKMSEKFSNPLSLSFSAGMHSIIPVDKQGSSLHKALLWSDLRSKQIAYDLRSTVKGMKLYRETGTPIHPMSPLCKLLWFKEYQSEVFEKAAKFVSIKEYIIHKLTGKYVIDYSIASASGMFQPEKNCWHLDVLKLIGIDEDKLSVITEPTKQIPLLKEMVDELKLPKDFALISGGSDGCLSNLGDNATAAGIYSISIGTSGAVRTVSEKFITDKQMRLFSYKLDEGYYVHGGAINTGGVALEWLGKEMLGDEDKPLLPVEITKLAEASEPGASGLLFFPYLQGERAPFWKPDIDGAFLGLTIKHGKKQVARAVMEGVLYNLCYVMGTVSDLHPKPVTIKASGGFTKSDFWLQMLADISNCKVEVDEGTASAARGAAILSLRALGLEESVSAEEHFDGKKFNPDKEKHKLYKKSYNNFVKFMPEVASYSEKSAD